MDILAAALIAFGAIIGVMMLIHLIRGHHIPKALTLFHGILVVSGLTSLIIFNIANPANAIWSSVYLFFGAAFLGIFILERDVRHKKIPITVILIHGLIASTSFVILVIKSIGNHLN